MTDTLAAYLRLLKASAALSAAALLGNDEAKRLAHGISVGLLDYGRLAGYLDRPWEWGATSGQPAAVPLCALKPPRRADTASAGDRPLSDARSDCENRTRTTLELF
jgi:hypothetical protein